MQRFYILFASGFWVQALIIHAVSVREWAREVYRDETIEAIFTAEEEYATERSEPVCPARAPGPAAVNRSVAGPQGRRVRPGAGAQTRLRTQLREQ